MTLFKEPISDPRIKRLNVEETFGKTIVSEKENWFSWEVFHQKKRGDHHIHVGIVHAPDSELALLFAKEQYGRRLQCANIWVVKSTDIFTISYDDQDMFDNATAPEKQYREASGFKVMEKINRYKKLKKEKSGTP
ncbi:MAG: 1,2-phenylacetyl-CoA epoxidase subunit B [Sphingobacteriales bacterium]|nr:MAG: 1,2-phenylacetyl-CoA epoxidase subunit B [Sphingobacteriales bacterium]